MFCIFTAIGIFVTIYYVWNAANRLIQFYRGHFTGSTIDFSKMSTAVITGASDGIGKAYAMELVRLGLKRIVLIARNEAKLGSVVEELAAINQSVETRIIIADFESTDIYDKIEQELADLHDIDILVNNVGANINAYKRLHEIKRGNIAKSININIYSTMMMSQIVVSKMVEDKRRGAVINISTSGVNFPPHMMLYASTKTCVSRFSHALRLQYQNDTYGITVQEVEPFFVSTKMARFVEGRYVVSAETCARQSLMTLGHYATTGGAIRHDFLYWMISVEPRWLTNVRTRRAANRLFEAVQKQEGQKSATAKKSD